jgi:hypothetical protein
MRAASSVLLAVLLLNVTAGAAHANRTLTLTSTFEGRTATATLVVPDDWKGAAKGDHVKVAAPSSRRRCDHVLYLRLGLLYVASTVTATQWVTSRLSREGAVADRGDRADGSSWGVATREKQRTSLGYGALVAGTGRLGRIMAEVRATSGLTAGCAASQARAAAKRLTRVVRDVSLQAAKA